MTLPLLPNNPTIPQLVRHVQELGREINRIQRLEGRADGFTTFANLTTVKTLDANSTTTAELADVLGTLIEALKDAKIITD